MSFNTISQCAADAKFGQRVTACVAAEGADNPTSTMAQLIWPLSVSADIAAAYESAVLANNPNPGGDESVITDQMILSAVQTHMADVVAPT